MPGLVGSPPLRAATYARVSSDEQAEKGFSLPEQALNLAAHCEALGFVHVGHFSDDISNIVRQRPGLSRIERLAEAGEIDLLVCVRLDRLCRIDRLREEIEEWFAERGVRVVYSTQHFDQTSSGQLQKGIMGKFAEYHYKLIREQTMAGRARKASGGKIPTNSTLYGYRFITKALATVQAEYSGRDGELEVLEEEARHVRRIFAWWLEGKTLRQIVMLLNTEGTLTRGGALWSHTQIRNLLRNSCYCGEMIYGHTEHRFSEKETTPSGEPKVNRRARDEKDWLRISVPAIVSREEWELAGARFAHNKNTLSGRPSHRYPLSGLIVCGLCKNQRTGEPLRWSGDFKRQYGKEYRYYICGSHARHHRESCGQRLPAEDVEARVIRAIRAWATPGVLKNDWLQEARGQILSAEEAAARIAEIEAAIEKTFADEDSIATLIEHGISEPVWRKRLNGALERRAIAEAELASVKRQATNAPDLQRIGEDAERMASFYGTLVDNKCELTGAQDGLRQIEITVTPEVISVRHRKTG